MKKVFLFFILTFLLSSCFNGTDNSDLEKVKSELLSGSSSISSSTGNEDLKVDSEEKKLNFPISSKYLTEEKFLEIDNFSISDFADMEQEITGKTLEKVDKIIVSFSNSESNFPDSSFELKKFKAGDEKFLYRAFKKYESLDYGENIYIFEAYSGDKVSKLEYKVILEKNLEKKDEKSDKKELESISTSDLPTSSVYGNPVEIGNGKITYSDVKGLEIGKYSSLDLENTEESVTNFLKNKYKNLFYWNTKRPISGENGLTFFVVRIEGKKYFYEKHYNIGDFYGVLSLESGDFEAEGTIEEKAKTLSELNISLKAKNDTFPMVKIANILFQSFKK